MFDDYVYLKRLNDSFQEHGSIFRGIIKKQYDEFGDVWAKEFNDILLKKTAKTSYELEGMVKAYVGFSLEAMRLQEKFDRERVYTELSYSDAYNSVYSNYKFMSEVYLPALYLTHFLWPHHYRLIKWIEEFYYPLLSSKDKINFCDIGIGTGFYSAKLLNDFENATGCGFDISDASIDHTKGVINSYGCSDRYHIKKIPFTTDQDTAFNSFICIELLEHLERPLSLLEDIYSTVKSGSLGIISAAVNAPNRDHIYLYRSHEEVLTQILRAGFKIEYQNSFDAYLPNIFTETVPSSACFICRKL